jgi:penicillin-binding protein 2
VEEKDVCGKTGTAQVISGSFVSKYLPYELRDHAWFVCFAPRENPEVAVVVMVEHGGFGGSAAAPLAGAVLKEYFELKGRDRR